jgi:hypothetical protein
MLLRDDMEEDLNKRRGRFCILSLSTQSIQESVEMEPETLATANYSPAAPGLSTPHRLLLHVP